MTIRIEMEREQDNILLHLSTSKRCSFLTYPATNPPAGLLFIFVIVVNVMQRKVPKHLPEKLKNWDFLPTPLHSLKPYDR
jgi:hypothetical protein